MDACYRAAIVLSAMLDELGATLHPQRYRALMGRIDAGLGLKIASRRHTDARSVAELRSRRWPGIRNRAFRKRTAAEQSAIMLEIGKRW